MIPSTTVKVEECDRLEEGEGGRDELKMPTLSL